MSEKKNKRRKEQLNNETFEEHSFTEQKSAKKKKKDKKNREFPVLNLDDSVTSTDNDFVSPKMKSERSFLAHKMKRNVEEEEFITPKKKSKIVLEIQKSPNSVKNHRSYSLDESEYSSNDESLSVETPSPKKKKSKHSGNLDYTVDNDDIIPVETPSSKKKKSKHSGNLDDTVDNDDIIPIETPSSKKKKSKHSGNLDDTVGSNESLSVETPSPMKKKSKHTSNLDDTVGSDESSEDDLPMSKTKKRRLSSSFSVHKSIDKTAGEVTSPTKSDVNVDDDGELEKLWTEEEMEKLLTCLKCKLNKASEKTPEKDMATIDWEEVGGVFGGERTASECQQKYQQLLRFAHKKRNGHEIVVALTRRISTLNNDLAKYHTAKQLNTFQLYSFRNKEAIMKLKQRKNMNYFTACAQLYEKCPQHEKDALLEEVTQRRKTNSVSIVKATKEKLSPFSLYYEKNKEKFSSSSHSSVLVAARRKYLKLSEHKKLHYIRKAVEKLEEKFEDPNFNQDDISMVKLNKQETRVYLTEVLGMPVLPAINGQILYLGSIPKTNMPQGLSGKEAIAHRAKLWDKVSAVEKAAWTKKCKEGMSKYKEEYRLWDAEAGPVGRLLAKRFHNRKSHTSRMFKPTARELYKQHSIEMPVTKVKFEDEPTIECKFSARGIYLHKQKQIGNEDHNFDGLSAEEKAKYADRGQKLRDKFAAALVEYCKGLSEEQRALYLGFKRAPYSRMFQRDVFENDFPVATYNVYLKPTKTSKNVIAVSNKIIKEKLHKSLKDAGVSSSSEDDDDSDSSLKHLIAMNSTVKKSQPASLEMASQLKSETSESEDSS